MKQPVPIRRYTQQTNPQSNTFRPMGAQVDDGILSGAADTLGKLGDALRSMDQAKLLEDEVDIRIQKLNEAREEDDARVYASSAMAQAGLHASTILREEPLAAQDGWRELTKRVETRFNEYRGEALKQAPTPTARRFLEQQLGELGARTLDAAAGEEQRARRQYRGDTIKGAIDTASGVLAADPSRYETSIAEQRALIGSLTDVTADERRGMLDYAETQFAGSTVAGMVERNPGDALRMLRDPEATGPVAHLTGAQRLSLANAAQAELDRREVKWKNGMRDRVSGTLDLIKQGLPVEDAPTVGEVRSAMGDEWARSYELQLAASEQFSGLDPRPSGELVALATAPEPPASAGAAAIQDFRAKRAAAASILERRQKDPMAYAINRGYVRPTDDLATALGEFERGQGFALQQFFRSRSTDAVSAAGRVGTAPMPLTAAESAVVGSYVDRLPASARANFFQAAARSMDPRAYRAMMQSVTPNNPANQFAAGTYARGGRSVAVGNERVTSEEAARLALRGDALLRPGAPEETQPGQPAGSRTTTPGRFAMPTESILRGEWAKAVGDGYRAIPEAEVAGYQVFRSVYAALAAEEGRADGTISSTLAKRAAQIASGGTVRVSGRETLLPWGTSANQFETAMQDAWPAIRERNGLRGRWSDYDFVAMGGGEFALMTGESPVRGANGRPVTVRVETRDR